MSRFPSQNPAKKIEITLFLRNLALFYNKAGRIPYCQQAASFSDRLPYFYIMRAAKTSKKSKNKKTQTKQVSSINKPDGITVEQWQILLRRQAAEKERFSITEQPDGTYTVGNYASRHTYEVVRISSDHPLNRCNCMDFKVSRLKTCKHIEAVKKFAKGRRRKYRPDENGMPGTTVYADYSEAPRLRIYYAGEDAEQIKSAAGTIFNADGFADMMSPAFLQIRGFLSNAASISHRFRCTPEATEIIDRFFDDRERNTRLDAIFSSDTWWTDYLSNGIIPYRYQIEGIMAAARSGRHLIADEMGLGKTLQAIGTASLLYREGFVSSILIVCPTSLKYQWQKEIKKFCGDEALVVEGSHLKRRTMYHEDSLFKIVSYNALSNDMKLLKSMSVDMIIMDEVQRLKNWNTQIAKGARRVKADYRIILSGTPLENKLEELYSVVQLADQFILGPYHHFKERHIQTDSTGKIIGYRHLNEIGDKLKLLMTRRRKADVALQLPERIDKNLFVPMTKEQQGIHEESKSIVAKLVMKWRRARFLSDADRHRLLLMLSQMRMVSDSTYILDQKTRHDTKIDEALSIITDITESGPDKIVLFSQWERMTRLVAMQLDKAGIRYEYLHGGIPSAKRKELMDNFNGSPSVRVFISTDAGSTGLNLQTANYLINMDLPWNPAVLEQRIGRIYRIGQKSNIQVINLISLNSIEEQMLSKLRFKADMFAGALDNGDDEVLLESGKLQTIVEQFDFSPSPSQEPPVAEVTEERVSEPENPDPAATPGVSDVIQEGLSFFTNLATILQNPESAKALVDELVDEDKDTGKTTLRIPVKSKDTVMQFVNLLGNIIKAQ